MISPCTAHDTRNSSVKQRKPKVKGDSTANVISSADNASNGDNVASEVTTHENAESGSGDSRASGGGGALSGISQQEANHGNGNPSGLGAGAAIGSTKKQRRPRPRRLPGVVRSVGSKGKTARQSSAGTDGTSATSNPASGGGSEPGNHDDGAASGLNQDEKRPRSDDARGAGTSNSSGTKRSSRHRRKPAGLGDGEVEDGAVRGASKSSAKRRSSPTSARGGG